MGVTAEAESHKSQQEAWTVYVCECMYNMRAEWSHNSVSSLFQTACQHQRMCSLTSLSDVITLNGGKTLWRFPPRNFRRLYFHVSVPMIMHARMWAILLLCVVRCAQAFKHESVWHVTVMILCVCVLSLLCSSAYAHNCQEIRCEFTLSSYVSFIPSITKRQIKNMGRKWSISVTEWYLERVDYETFSHSYSQECMTDTMGLGFTNKYT